MKTTVFLVSVTSPPPLPFDITQVLGREWITNGKRTICRVDYISVCIYYSDHEIKRTNKTCFFFFIIPKTKEWVSSLRNLIWTQKNLLEKGMFNKQMLRDVIPTGLASLFALLNVGLQTTYSLRSCTFCSLRSWIKKRDWACIVLFNTILSIKKKKKHS